ncbi:hypothetical protein Q5Y75_25290 [Ruegeria sp. 2205SS24-7]|uniref:hypothetical protein n=1 Tax=Ruegeria discodermiae TaxID=3064389 RepID=UPI0027413C63|nr:hypothetical protein [Ruegeria sp. 2205SS24-7]MDP5220506.1 hypothetical protein [Ruegeria sp. 2205SS24-7]
MTIGLALPAAAQDRQGNDTASDWRVTHYQSFGIWNSICDERIEDAGLVQRCYLRWVDVYSTRPEFGGQFVFVTPDPEGYQIEFGIEPGTVFSPNGFRIEAQGNVTWRTHWPGCLTGLSCRFSGNDADELLAAMKGGGTFRFAFRDRYGVARDLNWPLAGFPAALADFETQTQSRAIRH